ncbi:MAG: hypothetical protein WC455_17215 [Dehalococcoidia bacterium]|jgi:hypothetical protein
MKYLKQTVLIAKDCLLYTAIPFSENFIRQQRSISSDKLPYCYVTRYKDAMLLSFYSEPMKDTTLKAEFFADMHRVLDPDADLKDEFKEPNAKT